MRGNRSERYTLVPQSMSDEDEGVYEESPESSNPNTELLSTEHSAFLDSSCNSPSHHYHHHQLKTFLTKGDLDEHSPSFHPVSSSPHKPMSPARKCCFVACLFACVAYVVALLWLIPCHLMPCVHRGLLAPQNIPIVLKEWKVSLPLIEDISEPRAVAIGLDGESVIIFAFKLIERNTSSVKATNNNVEPACGVMALSGSDGKEVWRQLFYTQVEDVVCNVTDTNQDNIPDCVIVGSLGLLAAINASNGHTFWYLHNHDEQSVLPDQVSSPCSVNDINGDEVRDLLVFGTYSTDSITKNREVKINTAQLFFVSGSTGELIGEPVSFRYANQFQHNVTNDEKLPTPTIIPFFTTNATKVMMVKKGCDDGSDISDGIMIFDVDDLANKATEEQIIQSINISWPKTTSRAPYEEFCVHGQILSTVINRYDQSSGLLIILTGKNETILQNYQHSNGYKVKWNYKKENYAIKEIAVGKVLNKIVAFVILQPVPCPPACKIMNVVLDMSNGIELQTLTLTCQSTKLLFLGEKPDEFIVETAELEGGKISNGYNSSLTLLNYSDGKFNSSFSLNLKQPAKCNENNGNSAFSVVKGNGYIIAMFRTLEETIFQTISFRPLVRRIDNLLVHPNPV